MHHADPGLERCARRAGPEGAEDAVPPGHLDRSGVGQVVTEQDVHERGLAGPVLAQQRQDLARAELEADLVVGDQIAEALGDACQAEDRGSHESVGNGRRRGALACAHCVDLGSLSSIAISRPPDSIAPSFSSTRSITSWPISSASMGARELPPCAI